MPVIISLVDDPVGVALANVDLKFDLADGYASGVRLVWHADIDQLTELIANFTVFCINSCDV